MYNFPAIGILPTSWRILLQVNTSQGHLLVTISIVFEKHSNSILKINLIMIQVF